jgi:tetratricopeptide (TPR) repeat protein
MNELCSSYRMLLQGEAARGLDPAASLKKAIEPCDRAIALDPSFLYPYNTKTNMYLQAADYLVGVGRSPEPALKLAMDAVEVIKARSPDWPWTSVLLFAAYRIRAMYELDSGVDPGATLDLAARYAEDVMRRGALSPDAYHARGMLGEMRALHLLRQGKDPEAALREARDSWQRGMAARPWDLGFRVGRARAEIIRVRAAVENGKATAAQLQAAFEPLLPLLAKERRDPRLYQALAEIHELQATWLLGAGKEAQEDLDKGLAMIEKALAINPRMAAALATKGALFLAQARAAKEPSARREAARRANEALTAAVQENPLLERATRPAMSDAKKLLGKGGARSP